MTRTRVMVSVVALVILAGAQLALAHPAISIVNPSTDVVPLTLQKLNANETTLFSDTFDANVAVWTSWSAGTRLPQIDQTAHNVGPSVIRAGSSDAFYPDRIPGTNGPLHIDTTIGEVSLYFRIHFADPAAGASATTYVRLYNNNAVDTANIRIDPAATGNGGIYLYAMTAATAGAANRTANIATGGAAAFTGTQTRDYRLNIVRAANGNGTLTLHYHNGTTWVSLGSYTTFYNAAQLYVPETFDFIDIFYTNGTAGSLDNRSYIDQIMVTQVIPPSADVPTIDLAGGVYPTDQAVTISAQEGAEIWYTTDGSTPAQGGATSLLYDGTPVAISGTKVVLKARAYVEDLAASAVASAIYYVVPSQNRYAIPEATLTMDGDLSDWPASSTWSAPYIWWNGFELTSTTVSKMAWNDANDVLYIAVQTNENIGGDLTLGMTRNPNVAIPMNNIESSQILFYYTTNEANNIWIENTVNGVITGITGACSYDAGTGLYTYEIAHPFRSDWVNGSGDQSLSADEVIYLYSILTEAGTSNGMNLSYQFEAGKSAYLYTGVWGVTYAPLMLNSWARCAAVTLEAAASDIMGDANHDGMVDVGDLGILAANYGTLTGATWEQGDFNGDGAVDVGDLGILAANYGTGVEGASDFSADYAKAFGTAAEEEETSSSLCSGLGLPLVAGLLLMGLCLMIKMEE